MSARYCVYYVVYYAGLDKLLRILGLRRCESSCWMNRAFYIFWFCKLPTCDCVVKPEDTGVYLYVGELDKVLQPSHQVQHLQYSTLCPLLPSSPSLQTRITRISFSHINMYTLDGSSEHYAYILSKWGISSPPLLPLLNNYNKEN